MDAIRIGNFCSSEIYALMSYGKRLMTADELKARPKSGKGSSTTIIEDLKSFGDLALTYIKSRNTERKLGRSLNIDVDARTTSWGKCVEPHVFKNVLDTSYVYIGDKTISHPTLKSWCGTPDVIRIAYDTRKKAVGDIKCPATPQSFCDLIDAWEKGGINQVRADHSDGEKFYWQLVSNAVLTDCDEAELIVYFPYKHELDAIRIMATEDDRYLRIIKSNDEELPYILTTGYYKNLTVMRFEVPQSDKEALKDRVILASDKLIPFYYAAA